MSKMSEGEALNAELRSAMATAGLTPRRLALRVGVSEKTVSRWLADPDLVPHPINRNDACEALGASEEMLWPKIKNRIKLGPDRELVQSYPYRSAAPSTLWGELIEHANEDLFFAGYTNYFLWLDQPDFVGTLRRKAQQGCRLRFLLGDPDGEVTRQREQIEDVALAVSTRIRITLEHLARLDTIEQVEARFTHAPDAINHVGLSVFKFDEQMLVTPHLARLVGHDSPMLHLRKQSNLGMFSRFEEHAAELWSRAVPIPSLPTG